MIITVKILRGKECTIEATGTSSVSFIKQLVARELDIPVDQQRLVFRGKTLSDSQCLGDYNIVDGTKLHLLIRKAETQTDDQSSLDSHQMWTDLDRTLQKHFAKEDVGRVLNEMKMNITTIVNDLSLDDIERYAKSMVSVNVSDGSTAGGHQSQQAPSSSSRT